LSINKFNFLGGSTGQGHGVQDDLLDEKPSLITPEHMSKYATLSQGHSMGP